jgi:hypothetical protein
MRATGTAPGSCTVSPRSSWTGERWQEPEARYRQDSLDQVRSALGQERFDRAYAQGKALSLDQALDLARGTDRSA